MQLFRSVVDFPSYELKDHLSDKGAQCFRTQGISLLLECFLSSEHA